MNSKASIKLSHAIFLARKCHAGQKRLDGSDYIKHPLNVLETLRKSGFDEEDLLIAAILHDVCEDTGHCNLAISREFGERVGYIINALSKNKKSHSPLTTKVTDKEDLPNLGKFNYRFWMYISRLASGIMEDPYVMFIKIADQIDNLRSMDSFKPEKQRRKIEEIEECFLPIYRKFEPDLESKYLPQYRKLKSILLEIIKERKIELYK